MAVNKYFGNFPRNTSPDQHLLEALVVESIKVHGEDVWYVPRESWNKDDFLLGENAQSKFKKAYMLEAYLTNTTDFEGQGDYFSKFGLELRDVAEFVISKKSFLKYIPVGLRTRPKEGDLLYVPVYQRIFEIKFIEEEGLHFSFGKANPYMFQLRCEVFRYSNEEVNTGIEEVDTAANESAYQINLYVTSGTGNFMKGETCTSPDASGVVWNWDPILKTITLIQIKGEFVDNTVVVGATSQASYTITTTETLDSISTRDLYDNKQVETEGDNGLIVYTEVNPMGTP